MIYKMQLIRNKKNVNGGIIFVESRKIAEY